MKKAYDFSKAQRGKFCRASASFILPVYLDPDVQRFVEGIAKKKRSDISTVVNNLLKTDMQLAKAVE